MQIKSDDCCDVAISIGNITTVVILITNVVLLGDLPSSK